MKKAILISGQQRGDWRNNIERLKRCFPGAHVYTSTWWGEDGSEYDYKPRRPDIHYHPTLEVRQYPSLNSYPKESLLQPTESSRSMNKRTKWGTLQILHHDMLQRRVHSFGKKYDLIIRARFDTIVSEKVDWDAYCKRSFDENIAMGFDIRNAESREQKYTFDKLHQIERSWPVSSTQLNRDWAFTLLDPLIIHPRFLWDSKRVWKLHEERKLQTGEFGWYQILSEPFGHNHVSTYGGAMVEKFYNQAKKQGLIDKIYI